MKKTYKITFPFTGQVKTQLKIITNKKTGRKQLAKPTSVKIFERKVRSVLAQAFPLEMRPLEGYIKFEMYHFTRYKRDKEGYIEPIKKGDLDNLVKNLQDCFEPVYGEENVFDKHGNPVFTPSGQIKKKKVVITEGVLRNDKFIKRAILDWVPVETEKEERIEVYLTPMTEEELFRPRLFEETEIIELKFEL